MKTAQLKAVAPASAVARPTMAQRAAFKAAPAPSVARPSFARRVQKLQKAAGVQARNVVVVRAADDKVCCRRPGAGVCGGRARSGQRQPAPQPGRGAQLGGAVRAADPQRLAALARARSKPASPSSPAAGGGDRPGRRLRLRQVHLHAPVRG